MQPHISIVIPTLHEEDYLPILLENLSLQKSMTFEVIVVDSSEDDKTKNVLHAHARPYKLQYVKVVKQNVSFQKNEGAKYARGKYIVFLDADSQVDTDFTLNILHAVQQHVGLVYRPNILPDDKKYLSMDKLLFVWNIFVRLSFFTKTPFGDGGCLIFERNFFTLIGGFNEGVLAEDYEILRRCIKWGVRPRFISEVNVTISLRRFKRDSKPILIRNQLYSIYVALRNKEIKLGSIRHDMGGRIP